MMEPENEAELAEMVASAARPLRIRGGGTQALGSRGAGDVLSVARLCGVTLYEPGALTLVAQAGTPVAEVERVLSEHGQRLAFEPMDHRGLSGINGTPTIGGVVAANVSGPRRISVGACRDFLLGVRFVDGRGRILKNGGRVMKNVTGYDLVKLLAGSYGTLGVLSEVAFKVLPDVEAVSCICIDGLDAVTAVKALCRATASPFEVTGAAHAPDGIDGDPMTMIRIEGFEKSVRYRAGRLRDLLADFGEVRIENDAETVRSIWTWVRDVKGLDKPECDIWRISVKPTDGPVAAAALDAAQLLFDWGGGLLWAAMPAGVDARARLAGIPGHATRIRGTGGQIQTFQPEPEPLRRISEGLRNQFDPRRILNPGLMA